jgi:sugar/nucleoside kinase (ribokinase family)
MNTWPRIAIGWASGVTETRPESTAADGKPALDQGQGYDVLLLGSYFCDLIFTGLPAMPRLGADLFGTEFDMVPGATYRTALACHRLGLRAGWLCDFGTDLFSRFVLDMAAQDGLDMSLFRHHPVPVRRVSAAFSFVHDRGFISYMDPIEPASPVEFIQQHRSRAVLLSHLTYDAAQAALADAARAAGTLVYMDCQADAATLATPGVPEALRRVDIFAPNESEALHLTAATTVEAALEQLADLAPLVIIKRGSGGAVARQGHTVVHSPALSVNVCDTTGAGDCFNAGFLYGHLAGMPLAGCLRRGNICGALSTLSRGSATLPTAAEVEAIAQKGALPKI